MSGGTFDYKENAIGYIADEIQTYLDEHPDADGKECPYSEKTLYQLRNAIKYLRIAKIYAQRVDKLLAGDDLEDAFHRRLQEDFDKHGFPFKKIVGTFECNDCELDYEDAVMVEYYGRKLCEYCYERRMEEEAEKFNHERMDE